MKSLLVFIPVFNEEILIKKTILSIPKTINGYRTEILIIDDGSTDKSYSIYKKIKSVKYIIRKSNNLGLADSYNRALSFAKKNGCELLLIFDADQHYNFKDVNKFIKIQNKENVDVVIGNRENIYSIYSGLQRIIHRIGAFLLSILLGKKIDDPPSGFRLFNDNAINKMPVVYSKYTYTVESFFQYVDKGLKYKFVNSKVNKVDRKSRLYSSPMNYCWKILNSIVMVVFLYRFHKLSIAISIISFFSAILLGLRYLYYFIFIQKEEVFLPSLILSTMLVTVGIVFFAISVMTYFLKNIRLKIEEIND